MQCATESVIRNIFRRWDNPWFHGDSSESRIFGEIFWRTSFGGGVTWKLANLRTWYRLLIERYTNQVHMLQTKAQLMLHLGYLLPLENPPEGFLHNCYSNCECKSWEKSVEYVVHVVMRFWICDVKSFPKIRCPWLLDDFWVPNFYRNFMNNMWRLCDLAPSFEDFRTWYRLLFVRPLLLESQSSLGETAAHNAYDEHKNQHDRRSHSDVYPDHWLRTCRSQTWN